MPTDPLAPPRGAPVALRRSRLLALTALTLAAFAAAELALRIRTEMRHSAARFDYIVDDPAVGPTLVPDVHLELPARERLGGTPRPLRINRHGLRGADVAPERAPGTTRVICLGSSVVFGPESGDTELFTTQLQRLLNDDAAAGAARVEVLNAGVPGRSARSVELSLRHRDARFRPDVAVIYAVANDIGIALWELGVRDPTALPVAPSAVARAHPLKRLWRTRSTLYVAGRVHFAAARPASRTTEQLTFPAEAAELFYRDYRALVRTCRELGIVPVLATEPVAFRREQPYDQQLRLLAGGAWGLDLDGAYRAHDALNDAVRRVAADEAVVLVDLARTIAGGADNFIDQIHLTPRGHRAVAAELAAALRDHDLLAPRRP